MRGSRLRSILSLLFIVTLAVTLSWSSTYRVLYNFSGRQAGFPSSGLVLDSAGNGYGTTSAGGFNDAGTVYEASTTKGLTLIYGFHGGDGRVPQGNLTFDSAGNLYGTTVYGGANKTGCGNQGCGTVFKLSPSSKGGAWTETVLYSFTGGDDGANPESGVIFDSQGNLYGTTFAGGSRNSGVVFQLVPSGDAWTENVLYTFTGGGDGGSVQGGLIFDTAGNLYGMTGGTVFEMNLIDNQWTINFIHYFNPKQGDGAGAAAGLTIDPDGNLYGTTTNGGQFGFGTVFEMTLESGTWTEQVLYSFLGGNDGAMPSANVILDSSGNLYGTTYAGGSGGFSCFGNGCGTVFALRRGENGQWTEARYVLPGTGDFGIEPTAPLVFDKTGKAYGTTTKDGLLGDGVIFRVVQ